MGITVENVSKYFGSFTALDNVSVDIKTGSLVALLGPSGSGKSTLLRIIAGLESLDDGSVYLTGRDATHSTVQDRQVGFVFQHYALFKHLTVRENIAFGPRLKKWPENRVKNRTEELLELVQMSGYGDRYPSQLSGGQRQRIALARALALEPQILLLDEPFGALDAKVRKDLRNWLRRLHDEVRVTTVFVTHDQEEAMAVSDEIVVMNQGRIEQIGSATDLYDNPASPFVMSFIGPVNVLPATTPLLQSHAAHSNGGVSPRDANLFLRPHDVEILSEPQENAAPARVLRIVHLGWEIQAELALEDGQSFSATLTRDRFDQLNLKRGQPVFVRTREAKVFATAGR